MYPFLLPNLNLTKTTAMKNGNHPVVLCIKYRVWNDDMSRI